MTPAALWMAIVLQAVGGAGESAKTAPFPVAGTVVGANCKPAACVDVAFSTHQPGVGWGKVVVRAETDAGGRLRFELPGAADGGDERGMMWAYRPGALIALRPTASDFARTFPDVVLRAEDPPRKTAFAGRIVDRDGRAVADASVWTTNEWGRPIRARTDADGRFHLENVPPRRSFLFVEAAGFRFFGKIIDTATGRRGVNRADPNHRASRRADDDPDPTPVARRGPEAGAPARVAVRSTGSSRTATPTCDPR